jgi:hypothetical protein
MLPLSTIPAIPHAALMTQQNLGYDFRDLFRRRLRFDWEAKSALICGME